jgi:hypothetical protein
MTKGTEVIQGCLTSACSRTILDESATRKLSGNGLGGDLLEGHSEIRYSHKADFRLAVTSG